MANKIIDLTGDAIETALQLVDTSVSVDQAPTIASSYFVTSGTLHTYIGAAIQGSLANGPKITASTFSDNTLVDQGDTIATNISNDKVATTAAIRDYVLDQNRASVSNVFWDGNSATATVTNLHGNASINTSINGAGTELTLNLIANENAQYLVTGTYSDTVQTGVTGGTHIIQNLNSFFNASNLDVLINKSDYNEINLTIIRFV